MSRTFKDRKDHIQYQKRRARPLNRKFVSYLQNGPDDVYIPPAEDEYLFGDEDELCPCCGNLTGFDAGFLFCNECGWVDAGPEAFPPREAA